MRGLPRLHPADRGAAIGQGAAVLMVGGWSAWTTYGAAQTWGWLPDWAGPMVAVSGGTGAAVATLGGLLFARLAGQQDARRVLQDHREAQARYRAEHGQRETPVRYPSRVGRHRRAAETNDQTAIVPAAQRVLDGAAARRLELPVGAGAAVDQNGAAAG